MESQTAEMSFSSIASSVKEQDEEELDLMPTKWRPPASTSGQTGLTEWEELFGRVYTTSSLKERISKRTHSVEANLMNIKSR